MVYVSFYSKRTYFRLPVTAGAYVPSTSLFRAAAPQGWLVGLRLVGQTYKHIETNVHILSLADSFACATLMYEYLLSAFPTI